MIWLELRLETPGVAALARTLLHSFWEGAAVALALAMVLCVVRSPRIRYAAACLAMVLLLASLVVTFAQLVAEQPTQPARVPAPAQTFSHDPPPVPSRDARPIDALMWLVPFWLAGVLIFHVRGIASWMAAGRLRHTGVCCAPELWRERLERLKSRLRMETPVALLESCLTEVPVVIGHVRPVILMPVGLVAGLPVAQVEAILLHELAHIRRHDYAVNLLQVFVEGLLFYHPAVWWISGAMRTERENCCDDLVVSVTGGALEYATALTALETRRRPREVPAATGGSVVNRIQRLLGRRERRYVPVMPVFTAAILTVAAVTATMALQVQPVQVAGQVGMIPAPAPVLSLSPPPVTQPHRLLAQAVPAPPAATQAAAQPTDTGRKIAPDDLLSISVSGQPGLSGRVRVQADGTITIPLLKDGLRAGGMLPAELEADIARNLREQQMLAQPVVSVTVVTNPKLKPVYPPLAKMARAGADPGRPFLFAPVNGAEIRRVIQQELKTQHDDIDDTKEPR